MRKFLAGGAKVSTRSRKLGKVRKFVRGSGNVSEIRDFLKKVREENFYANF